MQWVMWTGYSGASQELVQPELWYFGPNTGASPAYQLWAQYEFGMA